MVFSQRQNSINVAKDEEKSNDFLSANLAAIMQADNARNAMRRVTDATPMNKKRGLTLFGK